MSVSEACSRQDAAELWRRRSSSASAREELVRRHLGLARGLAARYRNVNEPFEDLVQVAGLGLVKAVERYDPERGTPFAAYATPTILGELRRYFRDTSWSLHVPRSAKELALEVQNAVGALLEERGHSPTVIEVAEHLGRSTEEVVEGLETAQAHFAASLDAPLGASAAEVDVPATLAERTGRPEEGYGVVELSASLQRAMRCLPERERRALDLRLRRNLRQSEIAALMDCSQMQVSRMLRRAGLRLREQMAM